MTALHPIFVGILDSFMEAQGKSVERRMTDRNAFTLVFEGNIRRFDKNPLTTETPFGVAMIAGVGNAFDQLEEARPILERIIGEVDGCDCESHVVRFTPDDVIAAKKALGWA